MEEENNPSINSEGFRDKDTNTLLDDVQVSVNHRKWPKLNLTIEPAVFAFFLADGLSGPVIVNLIMLRSCEIHFHFNQTICSHINDDNKNETDIEALIQPYTSVILTGMNILSVLLPSILSMFLGSWSDYNGRKLLLVIPLLGYCLKYVLLLTFTLIPSLDPIFLLATVLPPALTGGFISFLSGTYSYLTDITEEENQAFRISVLEAFIFFGGIISALCTSPLYNYSVKDNCLLVFSLSAAITLLAVLYNFFFITESVQRTEDGTSALNIFKFQFIKDMMSVCFKKREKCKRAIIFLVITSLTTTICSMEGETNIKYLFLRLRFGWSIYEYSIWGCVTLLISFSGILITSLVLVKWLKIADSALGMVAYATSVAGTLYIAFVPSNAPHMMYYAGFLSLFGGASAIAGRTLLSKSVAKEELGKLFALTGACETIFPLAVVPLYTYLYDSTIEVFPSAFCLLTASILLLNFVFYLIIYVIQRSFRES